MGPRFRQSITNEEPGHDTDYWISYSDMMAGLLLVFIIILIGTLFVLKSNIEREAKQLEEAKQELKRTQNELAHIDKNVADILGVRTQLLDRIRTRFEKSGGQITFDDATGAVRLGSNILFREGSAVLTPKGQRTLDDFLPIYFEALLGDPELRKYVDRITFEGHTNSNFNGRRSATSGYLFNLWLSQERAYHAMRYALQSSAGRGYNAKKLLAASGFSSSRLIYKDEKNQVEDKARSRRIEIRFRLKDEEALRQLKRIFDERSIPSSVD